MSIHLPQVEVTLFDSQIKAEFQAQGFLLKNTMQQRKDVTGERVRFQLMGQGMAREKAPQDDVTPMNVEYRPVYADMKNWHASEYSDIFQAKSVNFDEKTALAKTIGMALGRRMDQIVINALASSGTTNIIGDGNTGFTFAKLKEINKIMKQKGVPTKVGRRFLAITAQAESDLLDETKLTSSDFVAKQAIERGGLDGLNVMGFNIIVIPDMKEGGLPISGGIRQHFAWHEFAAGYATGIDFRTTIDWIPVKLSHLVTGFFRACATAIDNTGIITINTKEAA